MPRSSAVVHDRKWWFGRRPQGPYEIDVANGLARAITHAYIPGWDINPVNGNLVSASGAGSDVMTLGGPAFSNSGTSNTGRYFSQDANLVNSRNPWTIAAVWWLDTSLNSTGTSDRMIATTATGANWSGAVDRTMGWNADGSNATLLGSLFDGGTKQASSSITIPYTNGTLAYAVISAGGSTIRAYINGALGASTGTSNNGFASYSAGSCFLSWGSPNTSANYKILSIIRTDGYDWKDAEAWEFFNNPWQMFRSRAARRIVVGPPVGGGPVLNDVSSSDGFFFDDPRRSDLLKLQGDGSFLLDSFQNDSGRLLQEGMYVSDARYSEVGLSYQDQVLLNEALYLEIARVISEGLYLSDTAATTTTSQQIYSILVSEGLYLDEARYSELGRYIIDFLLLGDSALAEKGFEVIARDGFYFNDTQTIDRSMQILEGLLLNDQRFFDLFIRYLEGLLFGESSAQDVTTPGQVINTVSASDGLMMNDWVVKLQQMLWSEGIYLPDTVDRTVYAVLIEYLTYGRLGANNLLGTSVNWFDYLGRRAGSTKWRVDL